jgi:hypothetical protein
MRIITSAVMSAGLALTALTSAVRAQTRDQARIAFTITAGYVLPRELWSVGRQPVSDAPLPSDTFAIGRRIRPTVSFGFSGIYFPGNHLGWVGEAYLIGLGFEDRCSLVYASGSSRNRQACASIDQSEKAATAVALNGGLVYRVASRAIVSPYVRAAGGILFTTQSSIRMIGQFPSVDTGEPVDAVIYPDNHDSRVTPTAVLGLGFTSALGRGYQLRWEVRDNIATVRAVTGATLEDGTPPPTATRVKHLISFNLGFDVVLERRRGHRY